jgi:ATP-binding cassette subfamily F protein 3
MSYITGTSISYSYPDSCFNILENLSFKINPESKIGLIGANGCGKTTLFKIISRQITDFDGSISKHRNLRIGLLPQEIDFSAVKTPVEYIWQEFPQLLSIQNEIKQLEASQTETSGIRLGELYSRFAELDGYDVENRINKLTSEFGFTHHRLEQDIVSFSGGEKTKLGLIKLLADKPDLLLLDEPTNHLDLETMAWLENYLSQLKIPFVVISHDRKFLDKAVNGIWLLKAGKIKEFTGNYSFF